VWEIRQVGAALRARGRSARCEASAGCVRWVFGCSPGKAWQRGQGRVGQQREVCGSGRVSGRLRCLVRNSMQRFPCRAPQLGHDTSVRVGRHHVSGQHPVAAPLEPKLSIALHVSLVEDEAIRLAARQRPRWGARPLSGRDQRPAARRVLQDIARTADHRRLQRCTVKGATDARSNCGYSAPRSRCR
jgi:hypothetical protein